MGKSKHDGTSEKWRYERIHQLAELLSFIALIAGAPAAVIELHDHAVEQQDSEKKEHIEAAKRLYREVDERFVVFTDLCLNHPRLDCYSVPRTDDPKKLLTYDEIVQQKILYSSLTDLFEVAYVEYHHKGEVIPEIKEIFESQWCGWDSYIKKFIKRPAYRQTWFELRDEFDKDFVAYMDTLAPPPK